MIPANPGTMLTLINEETGLKVTLQVEAWDKKGYALVLHPVEFRLVRAAEFKMAVDVAVLER